VLSDLILDKSDLPRHSSEQPKAAAQYGNPAGQAQTAKGLPDSSFRWNDE
jgi:hypothetical protein